jgi:excisionase family DNA binding protein
MPKNVHETLLRQIVREEIQELLPVTEKFINAREAASFLSYSLDTLYNLTSRKLIPFHKVSGHLLFKESELSEYIKKGGRI